MHATLNTSLWALGVALQIALLVVLAARGGARRLPMFTTLIAFYAVRSVVLFAVSGHVSRSMMGSIYNGFSSTDVLLQMIVAAEMAVWLIRLRGGWTRARGGLVAGLAAIAGGGGWFAGTIWKTHGPVSLDRGQVALAILFVLLFAWAAWKRVSGSVVQETIGFAIYSFVSLIAQVEKYRAAIAQNAGIYAAWSYTLATVYLLVLIFWLRAMWRMDLGAGHIVPEESRTGEGRVVLDRA